MLQLEDILAAREARVRRQRELLVEWPDAALLCLTVVFPGPVKRDKRSVRVGEAGVTAVREAFATALLFEEIRDLPTGFEAFFVVDAMPQEAKLRACAIEDTHPWGRLMDIDVLTDAPLEPGMTLSEPGLTEPSFHGLSVESVQPLSRAAVGLAERRCLLCDRPARVCMRARTHTLADLQARIDAMLGVGCP